MSMLKGTWLKPGVDGTLDSESGREIDRSHRNDGRGEILRWALPAAARRGGVVGRQGRNAFRTRGAIWKSTASTRRGSTGGFHANATGAPPTLCQSREYSRRYIGAYRRGSCRGNFEQAWETWPQL